MSNLKSAKIHSVRFHAAANIGPKELTSVQVGKDNVVDISFALVGDSCPGVLVYSKANFREYHDIVPMGDITRIRMSEDVVVEDPVAKKPADKKANA